MAILKEVIDYMTEKYGKDGAERLAHVKMIAHLSFQKDPPHNWKELVDKIALFNGITPTKQRLESRDD